MKNEQFPAGSNGLATNVTLPKVWSTPKITVVAVKDSKNGQFGSHLDHSFFNS